MSPRIDLYYVVKRSKTIRLKRVSTFGEGRQLFFFLLSLAILIQCCLAQSSALNWTIQAFHDFFLCK